MDVLSLSRLQFAVTAMFHIIFPMMSIGLGFYLFVMEALWLWTRNEAFYHQVRFWLRIFVLTFAVGVASGFPMAFQFGTNWARFATATGSFFGNILGFETTVAFTLEASFLGILIFGWKRVPPGVHLLATGLVVFGACLSAFWIIAANSWMQIPHGVHLDEAGRVVVDDYAAALFNPDTLVTYAHVLVAAIEATLFLIAGISAWTLLHNRPDARTREFFLRSLKTVIAIAIVMTNLQFLLGDLSGQTIAAHQPEKLAAMELHWETNRDGRGVPLFIVAWPSFTEDRNVVQFGIPNLVSIIITHTRHGQVRGITDFPEAERPTVGESALTFIAFRTMAILAVVMFVEMVIGCYYWARGRLTSERVTAHPRFLRMWIWTIPIGFIAGEAGWMVREVGRQPWVVYRMMRTAEGVSPHLDVAIVATVLAAIVVLYAALFVVFVRFVRRTVSEGPSFAPPEVPAELSAA
jgi:cytochrome d ubiquinol oxidase subunit I